MVIRFFPANCEEYLVVVVDFGFVFEGKTPREFLIAEVHSLGSIDVVSKKYVVRFICMYINQSIYICVYMYIKV